MNEHELFVFCQKLDTSENFATGIDAVLASHAFGKVAKVLFMGESVLALFQTKESTPSSAEKLAQLSDFGVTELYIFDSNSLLEPIAPESLKSLTIINAAQAREIMEESKHILCF